MERYLIKIEKVSIPPMLNYQPLKYPQLLGIIADEQAVQKNAVLSFRVVS
jgi:hypothetical protein